MAAVLPDPAGVAHGKHEPPHIPEKAYQGGEIWSSVMMSHTRIVNSPLLKKKPNQKNPPNTFWVWSDGRRNTWVVSGSGA